MLITFFSSCRKDIDQSGDGPTYTITGKLYLDCSMQPMSNQKVDLFQTYSSTLGGNLNGGILAETTTDSDGYFKFEFKDLDGLEEKIRIPAGQGYKVLLDYIPQNENVYDLKVYVTPRTNIKVVLTALNTYSTNDTLLITDFRNLAEPLKLPGPFNSGIVYEMPDFSLINLSYVQNILDSGYKLNNNPEVMNTHIANVCDTTLINITLNWWAF